jgi:DNA polymerase-3 subunit gamma/tau
LQVTGAARELARNSALSRHAEGVIELTVPKTMSHLAERNYQEKLKAALEQHFGSQIVLKVTPGEAVAATAAAVDAEDRESRHAEAARAVQGDRFVKELVDMFDARVVGSSVKSNSDKT